MSQFTIYHNPRCSKSRQTLALLQEHGIEPEVVLYLDTPPSPQVLKSLLSKLQMTPRQLLRKSEEAYRQKGLQDEGLDEQTLLKAMAEEPRLIERPIVVCGKQAVLGRPPENVLELLPA